MAAMQKNNLNVCEATDDPGSTWNPPTTIAHTIPYEIINAIIIAVAAQPSHRSTRSTLAAFSAVASHFRNLAQMLLFRDLTIAFTDPKSESLQGSLSSNSRLCSFVEKLTLSIPSFPIQWDPLPTLPCVRKLEILGHPNHWSMAWYDLPETLRWNLGNIFQGPSLHSVTVKKIHYIPIGALCFGPGVHTLVLKAASIWYNNKNRITDGAFARRTEPPRTYLRTLILRDRSAIDSSSLSVLGGASFLPSVARLQGFTIDIKDDMDVDQCRGILRLAGLSMVELTLKFKPACAIWRKINLPNLSNLQRIFFLAQEPASLKHTVRVLEIMPETNKLANVTLTVSSTLCMKWMESLSENDMYASAPALVGQELDKVLGRARHSELRRVTIIPLSDQNSRLSDIFKETMPHLSTSGRLDLG
ncbi:hypothetical protein D9615_008473 [Tricholomella constricta]|uniref:Uncharacterized protein n=1 Tax=Tricholomella constricta TaxID=117010 RepID=A0A8H5H3W2_9AGAR|nr:hypothetical protein D9615_008473 [Tricholomella constricta]